MTAERAPAAGIFDPEGLSYKVASRVPGFRKLESQVEEALHLGLLTSEQTQKIQHAFRFWLFDFGISIVGTPIVGGSAWNAFKNRELEHLGAAFALGTFKFGVSLAYERLRGV